MPKILTRLRIDEVSAVDKGAGEGVKVLLMKRADGAQPKNEGRLMSFLDFFNRKPASDVIAKSVGALAESIGAIVTEVTSEQADALVNYSPMSHTTERPSVPHNATLSPCHRRRSGAVGSGGTDAHLLGRTGIVQHARRCSARGDHGAVPLVGDGLRPFACRASMKGIWL